MEQPGSPFFNFFRRIFNPLKAPEPPSTPSRRPNPSVPDVATAGRFPTELARENATMLKQLHAAQQYKGIIELAANRYHFSPSVLCGIGSRESHWGLALKPPGPGGRGDFARRRPRGARTTAEPPDGPGYGRGLMQIDYDWHEFARTGRWHDPKENIFYACEVLDQARTFLTRKGLPQGLLLRGVLAAYNGGATAAWNAYSSGRDIDANTTGRDYSQDVLNRTGWFQLHGWR